MSDEMIGGSPSLWRAMICLSLAIGFEEDRARLGLSTAVDRLRDALVYKGLMAVGDERLLAGVIAGSGCGRIHPRTAQSAMVAGDQASKGLL
jgi:hypothetical protein